MSQVPVKWVDQHILRDKRNTLATTAVVPLSALRKWLEDERELSINHGEEGYVSILSLLASLGE